MPPRCDQAILESLRGRLLLGALTACGLVLAAGPGAAQAAGPARTESVDQAVCRLVEHAAKDAKLPVPFLTRLIWRESSFRTGVSSPAGAQGIAQFMPGTAAERGLADPFDPEQAIPEAARFLAELTRRFGNLGLAAAAYNGGPNRVANWLAGTGGLPAETRSYVLAVTGRTAEDWAEDAKSAGAESGKDAKGAEPQPESCVAVAALLRKPGGGGLPEGEAPFAPWGVQLAGNFSKSLALASYARARQRYATVLGDVRPMIIGTRVRSRGTRPYYRIRLPAASRQEADALCTRIHAAGGACVVLPS